MPTNCTRKIFHLRISCYTSRSKQTADIRVCWWLSVFCPHPAASMWHCSWARDGRKAMLRICLLPDEQSSASAGQGIWWTYRRRGEAHLFCLCILLQSQIRAHRASLSGEIQKPGGRRLVIFYDLAQIYTSEPLSNRIFLAMPRVYAMLVCFA